MKLLRHLITITKHRHKVVGLCFKAGIGWQGLGHDLSKYSWTELKTGAKYYSGVRSPNAYERDKYGYSSAWLHHKGRNRHHFEYWVDYSKAEKRDVPVEMPLRFAVESLCDRIAASKVYKGKDYTDSSALEYFERGGDYNRMHKNSADQMREWLTILSEKGEKYVLSHVKNLIKQDKKERKRK